MPKPLTPPVTFTFVPYEVLQGDTFPGIDGTGHQSTATVSKGQTIGVDSHNNVIHKGPGVDLRVKPGVITGLIVKGVLARKPQVATGNHSMTSGSNNYSASAGAGNYATPANQLPPTTPNKHLLFKQLLRDAFPEIALVTIGTGTPAVILGPFVVTVSSSSTIPARVQLGWDMNPNDRYGPGPKTLMSRDLKEETTLREDVADALDRVRELINAAGRAFPLAEVEDKPDLAFLGPDFEPPPDLRPKIDRVLESLLKKPELAYHVRQRLSTVKVAGPWVEDLNVDPLATRRALGGPNEHIYAGMINQPVGKDSYKVIVDGDDDHPWFAHDGDNPRQTAKDYVDEALKDEGWLLLEATTPAKPQAGPWNSFHDAQGRPGYKRLLVGIDPGSGTDGTGLVICEVIEKPSTGKQVIVHWSAAVKGPGSLTKVGSFRHKDDATVAFKNAFTRADNAMTDAGWNLVD